MRFSTLAIFALPLAVLATPVPVDEAFGEIEKRSASTVTTDIQTVNADQNAILKTLNSFGVNDSPTGAQLTDLANENSKLTKDFNTTIADTKASAKFTVAESTNIYNLLNGTVYPATHSLLTAFINHYPGLKKGGLVGIIHGQLTSNKASVQSLSDAIIAKSQGDTTGKGPALEKKFLADFDAAIAKYAS